MKGFVAAVLLVCAPAAGAAAPPDHGPSATIDHVAINAADPDAGALFYRRAFGFAALPTKLPNTRWLRIGHGIALHIIGGRTAPVAANRIVHVAVRTDDLARTIAYLDGQGVAWCHFTGKPRTIQTRSDGVRQIFIQDPDGYWVKIGDPRGKPQH